MRLVASSEGLFHFRLTWDSRLELPALHCCGQRVPRVRVCVCVFALAPALFSPPPPSLVYAHVRARTVYQLSRSALQCSQAPIMVGLVPFSSALEVMCLALQGRHHRYTHISAEILPVPAALHRNPGEMIIMTSAHSRGKR